MFSMHYLWEGWDSCLIHLVSCTLHPPFWHMGCLKCWQQARYVDCPSSFASSLKQSTDLGFSRIMMGNPDPGNSEQYQLQKMQFNPTNIYWTYNSVCKEGNENKSLVFKKTMGSQIYTSLAANGKWGLTEVKTKCTEKKNFWLGNERGKFRGGGGIWDLKASLGRYR